MSKTRLKLLIAEDNDADVFLIRRALEFAPLDFDFELASNGEEALKIVSRVTPDGKFDGMILDLNLTTHSGIDILKHVRGTPELAGTPVIILTSSDSPRDMESARSLGADAFIPKPMDLDEFLLVGRRIASLFLEKAGQRGFGPESASTC